MENLSPTGLYRQDRLWYTGRRSEWEGFSIMDPIQQRVNSAPAWIAAAICGGLALVAEGAVANSSATNRVGATSFFCGRQFFDWHARSPIALLNASTIYASRLIF